MAEAALFEEVDSAVLGPQKIMLKKYKSKRTGFTVRLSSCA